MGLSRKITRGMAGFVAVLALFSASANALMVDLGARYSPTTFTYDNEFAAPTASFTDWFAFSINPSRADVLTATISLAEIYGISSLETKLYKGFIQNGSVVNQGWLASGVDSSYTDGDATLLYNEISDLSLAGGNYLLRVTGAVDGTMGGYYVGIANFAAVPAPGVLSLLLSGLAVMGVFYRKKSA